jgi:predicted AAA+ superfamily ATPase
MASGLVRRNVTPLAEETLADTAITVISGARQVGKSTLMRQLLDGRSSRAISLDSAVDRAAAERDPDGFVAQYPQGTLAIDEIQRVPQLIIALKGAVDHDRRPGRFLVTGSADLLSLHGAEESLAGRAQTIPLETFSRGEIAETVEDFASFAWALPHNGTPADNAGYTRHDYLRLAISPAFPEIHAATARAQERWLTNYANRVLSRDTTDITGILHPDRLAPLLSLIAARNSGEFAAARVAREVDIPQRTIPSYLRALQAVYLVRTVPGWSNNLARRAVSFPKVSVADTGLAAHLAGADIDGLERDVSSTLTGGLIEGFVTGELAKQSGWSERRFGMSHYRDDEGREVDIVLEDRKREVVGVEVKAASTVGPKDFRGLEYLRDKIGDRFVSGIVLYTGTRSVPFGERLWALPLSTLWEH